MKKILLHTTLFLLPSLMFAQSFDTGKYTLVNNLGDGLYLVGVGGHPEKGDFKKTKLGVVAEDGTPLLKPIYSEIGEFVNGLAFIRDDDKYGYINESFQIVIPCEYDGVGSFNELGLVWVNKGGSTRNTPGKVQGGKFGVFDSQGRVVVPTRYSALGTFTTSVSKYGYISRNEFVSKNSTILNCAPNYKVYEYSYIDGTLLSSLDMRQGPYVVCSPKGNKSGDGIIDAEGNVVLPEKQFDTFFCPSEGYVPLAAKDKSERMVTNYFNVSTGSLVLNSWEPVDCITPYVGGNAILTIKNDNVIIDGNGNQVTNERYSFVIPSETGTYVTSNSNGFGMVDVKGNEIFPCCFNLIVPDSEGLFLIYEKAGALCGYINASGDYVIQPKFQQGYPFSNGRAIVKGVAGWGVIDKEGNTKIDCVWQDVIIPTSPDPDRVWVKPFNEKEFICIDTSTQAPAFPRGYRYVYSNFDQDFASVAIVGTSSTSCGIVSKDGTEMIPPVINGVEEVKELYKTMLKDGKVLFGEADLWRYNLKKRERSLRYPVTTTVTQSHWDY